MKVQIIKPCLLAALIGAGLSAQVANGTPVTVPDFSFENTAITPGGTTAAPNVGTNWTASGNGGVYLEDINGTNDFTGTTLPAPADGTNYVVENINGHTARCWQDIGPLQSNTVYTLTVAVGNTLTNNTGVGAIALVNGISPFSPVLGSTTVDSSSVTPGAFNDYTLVYTNGYQASGNLTILLRGDTGTQILFDNVRLDATNTPATAQALPITYSSPSTTVYVGTVVTLNENPSGTPPFTYQWQTDNGTGGATWSNTGSDSTNLLVDTSSFTPGTPVEFRVIVSGSSTSAPVTLTAINGQPVVTSDTVPALGSDVVGSSVTFSATFDGSRPITYQWWMADTNFTTIIPIAGATNSTLTITNLQLTNSAFYYLEAANPYGSGVDSSAVLFYVTNEPPAGANGVVVSPANQSGLGGDTQYTPTWTLVTNGDLLLGLSPTSSAGDFQLEHAGGIPFLTDGQFGPLPPQGNASPYLATCGNADYQAPQPPGSNIVYTLPASANGWDITNITVYGGWSDLGRDQQRYLVYYSTVAAPTNFNNLIADVNWNPSDTVAIPNQQDATRTIITSTNGVLARGVAALEFFFYTFNNGVENGYSGYAEFQAYGTPSQPLPSLVKDIQPATGFDVVGSQVTLYATFGSTLPLTYQWFKDGVPIPNATNPTLTLTNLQLTDTAVSPGYVLQASNSVGAVSSSACAFTVNPVPSPDSSNVVVSLANQTGGGTFTPTWALASGSLISGALPTTATYQNSFGLEGASGTPAFTDNQIGHVGNADNSKLVTCGPGGGQTVIYTLTGSQGGYNISNIVTYGGWSDNGRNQQAYTVSYSTVTSPTTFVTLDGLLAAPGVGGVPNMSRVTLAPSSGGILASNVYAVKFDFTTPAATDAGSDYQGYSELQIFGAPTTPLANLAPTLAQDILPSAGADVVGSSVTFKANFIGSGVAYQWQMSGTNIPGATGSTLTLNNLQLTDTGDYNVIAYNAYGTNSSSTNTFTVNAAPSAVNGTVAAPAYQDGYSGMGFTPTWTVAGGSLIAGQAPVSSTGNFQIETCGGVNYLTAGSPGTYSAGNFNLASGGPSGGTSATYSLGASPTGYNLNKVVVYGGWGDSGRDTLGFSVSYSTISDPNTFVSLTSPQTTYGYQPPGGPAAGRLTVTSSSGGLLAQNVAYVQINFTSVPNNWSGYGQVQVFGVPSAAPTPLGFTGTRLAGGNLIMVGAGGTPGVGYTLLSTTNLALPLSQWTTNTTGTFDGSGSFSNAIPYTVPPANRFFLLRSP